MGFYRGAEDVKCHQLVKSNRKNHTVASETEDLAFFTMVGMVGLLGGFPSLVSWFFFVGFLVVFRLERVMNWCHFMTFNGPEYQEKRNNLLVGDG